MSRLESEELNNGLLNSNVGGSKGVDDQIYLEEVSQGHASLGIMPNSKERLNMRQAKLVSKIHSTKKLYDKKLEKISRLVGLPPGNPLEKVVHKGEAQIEGMAKAMMGKGAMPEHEDLRKEFMDAIEKDNAKLKKRNEQDRDPQVTLEEQEGPGKNVAPNNENVVTLRTNEVVDTKALPHLYPHFPPMPPHTMAVDLFGEEIITNTISHNQPTIAGIIAILQRFLGKLHQMLVENKNAPTADIVIEKYFALVNEYIAPFEEAYRDRPIFPIREDGSVFMSLGAYRDHLLGETLRQAFKTAANPNQLFVGAVVQNCFGLETSCRTGVEVKGKDKNGNPITEVSDRPPDVNGIEQFCADPDYVKYCESGQIRVLYVNETESNGPTTARYFASKLWGGETYFVQADAHLRFAKHWDRLYQEEVQAAKSYPKAILSSYPPGFSESDPPYVGGSRGTRLCTCEFSTSDVEHRIIRINTGNNCKGEEVTPTQIAYIAAGFFFARAEFLVDIPFDPYLPWCFMGEEIALSLRAWTHGWDIYAPRKNLIAHQYRPGSMGLPKFWENTGRVFGRPGPGFNTLVSWLLFFVDIHVLFCSLTTACNILFLLGKLQTITIQRVKHMVGYKGSGIEDMENNGVQIMLTDFQHYGPGDVRTMPAFLNHTRIDLVTEKCGWIDWCNDCTLP